MACGEKRRSSDVRQSLSGLQGLAGASVCPHPAHGLGLRGLREQLCARPDLWSHMLTVMFEGEHVAIELRDPLPTLHGQLKVADGVTDVRLDLAPEKRRILLSEISWTDIFQPLIDPDFSKLVV